MPNARLILSLLMAPGAVSAQAPMLASDRYRARPDAEGQVTLFRAGTRDLVYLEARVVRLASGAREHEAESHGSLEELVIVTEGTLTVILDSARHTVRAGGAILLLPGDRHVMAGAGPGPATFYVLSYRSRLPSNPKRGRNSGGSAAVAPRATAVGGADSGARSELLERPTTMLERLSGERVVLRPGQAEGVPHQHRDEHLILVLAGSPRVRLGDKRHQTLPGDLLFVGPALLHAVENAGSEPAEYLSLQWR